MSIGMMPATRRLMGLTSLIALSVAGCSDADPGPGQDDQGHAEVDAISMVLLSEGFDISTIEFDGNAVIVEGDIVFNREYLLDIANQQREKGYLESTIFPLLGGANNLRLVLAPNLPPVWRTASLNAAAAWSSASWAGVDININIAETNTGPVVDVRYLPINDVCTRAIGAYPELGIPGDVVINSQFDQVLCNCTYTAAIRQKIATHELGHILGFRHPSPLPFDHIAGTASGTSYATVMKEGCVTTLIQSDDRLSAKITYGP